MNDEIKYLNFPIYFLNGFFRSHIALTDILYYALYRHSLKLYLGDEIENFQSTARFFGVNLCDVESAFNTGHDLYHTCTENWPMTGISCGVLFDFYKNYKKKSDFEKACLLGYLAFKSIVGNKTYCKLDNKFWLSRMDGRAYSYPIEELSPEIQKFSTEYQTRKIKCALVESWGLVTYSYHNRGFYISFTLDLNALAMIAEGKKLKSKVERQKAAVEEARRKAKMFLNRK